MVDIYPAFNRLYGGFSGRLGAAEQVCFSFYGGVAFFAGAFFRDFSGYFVVDIN